MNIKNEHGITLLALIVTVIVMVILASIAISASVGDNGLIKQTKTSTIKASVREVEEALDAKLLLKEKEEIKKGNLNDLTISILTGSDTSDDNSDDILSDPEKKTIDGKKYNVYRIDISKLDIKGDYGKGSTTDVFKVQVELDADENETNNYEVTYIP